MSPLLINQSLLFFFVLIKSLNINFINLLICPNTNSFKNHLTTRITIRMGLDKTSNTTRDTSTPVSTMLSKLKYFLIPRWVFCEDFDNSLPPHVHLNLSLYLYTLHEYSILFRANILHGYPFGPQTVRHSLSWHRL